MISLSIRKRINIFFHTYHLNQIKIKWELKLPRRELNCLKRSQQFDWPFDSIQVKLRGCQENFASILIFLKLFHYKWRTASVQSSWFTEQRQIWPLLTWCGKPDVLKCECSVSQIRAILKPLQMAWQVRKIIHARQDTKITKAIYPLDAIDF